MSEEQRMCRNCEAPLAGEYCGDCGQRDRPGDLRLRDLAGEFTREILSWDSRLWRTLLPLLFRPGFLTVEFFQGHRARYVAPLRLYLIISFVLFLALSLGAGGEVSLSTSAQPPGPEGVTAPATTGSAGNAEADTVISLSLADDDSPQWLQSLEQRLERNAQRAQTEPGSFMDLLLEYLPQLMFLLLPLFALLIQLCYLMSPFHYLQHLVFALHFHSYAYLLYLFAALIEGFGAHGDGLLLLVLMAYLPLALKRVYGSGTLGALLRSLLIFLCYALLLALGLAAAALLGLALM